MSHLASRNDGRSTRVLLVDDNKDFLRVATEFLQRSAQVLVVGAVCGAEDALARVESLQPQVILIDLEMPGLTGLETIPRLRSLMPFVGIIALSLSDSSAWRQAALAAGADDLVSKSALLSDLLPAIWEVMDDRVSLFP